MNHFLIIKQVLCKVLNHAPMSSACSVSIGRKRWHRPAGHMNLANQPADKRKGGQKQVAVCIKLLMKTGHGFGLLRAFSLYLSECSRSPLLSDLDGLGRDRELLRELQLGRGKRLSSLVVNFVKHFSVSFYLLQIICPG